MSTRAGRDLGAAIAMLLPFLAGTALVAVRGEVGGEVVALLLACTVVAGGRIGGRIGGIGGALMAAVTFDFFHTQPYLSLKIASADDVLVTAALLVVGLLVGGLAGSIEETRALAQRRYRSVSAVTRVLTIAAGGPVEDVELAVRAELIDLLHLDDCAFTAAPVDVPLLERDGSWVAGEAVADEGFTLPTPGVAVPVEAHGARLGSLVCLSTGARGIPTADRRAAYALGEVLGLAMSAQAAA